MVLHRWRKSLKWDDKGINNVWMKIEEEKRGSERWRGRSILSKTEEPRRPRVKFQVGATWHGTMEHCLSSSIFLFRFGSVGFWIFKIEVGSFQRESEVGPITCSKTSLSFPPPPPFADNSTLLLHTLSHTPHQPLFNSIFFFFILTPSFRSRFSYMLLRNKKI